MANRPDIRYAHNGGVAIAYQVIGDGPVDLVFVSDFVSNLVYGWQSPHWRGFYERLARSFRVILFDKRGTGLSDLGGQFPSLETRMDDVRAVLDAVGSSSAIVMGSHDGSTMAALYAATYPERTRALVLFQAFATRQPTDDLLTELAELRDRWGTQEYCDELLLAVCPTLYANDADHAWFADWLRVGTSPSVAYALNRASNDTDIRDVLSAIRVPTLVVHRGTIAAEDAADVAPRIPGAQETTLVGGDWWGVFLSPEIVDEIERFAEGRRAPTVPDTILATLLFTDIVGSTEHAARLGDHAWRELLERHHTLVRRELARFRGQERDTAGDGFFATFDGPARAIRCAQAIGYELRELGMQMRAGLHTGECEIHDGKVAGIAVSIAARVADQAAPGEVVVTGTVKDLVAGTGISFEPRGERQLKGLSGSWPVFAALSESGLPLAGT